MMPVPNSIRRRVTSAFRFHSRLSPANAAVLLTTVAVERGFSDPRRPPPGSAHEQWASVAKAPLWVVQAAATWLYAHAALTDPDEIGAAAEVVAGVERGGEP